MQPVSTLALVPVQATNMRHLAILRVHTLVRNEPNARLALASAALRCFGKLCLPRFRQSIFAQCYFHRLISFHCLFRSGRMGMPNQSTID